MVVYLAYRENVFSEEASAQVMSWVNGIVCIHFSNGFGYATKVMGKCNYEIDGLIVHDLERIMDLDKFLFRILLCLV